MNERANQPVFCLVEFPHQIGAAFRAADILLHAFEHAFDLLIEFDAVSDDQDA